ncbi:5'/3'-nucleotidase SurE [Oleiharenicola lentus]|jgi:5'-nucleotidase|uniref:5'-nucleotidase n=1 Tax=Oleiharenicola lentus TaxID=2508720 RepID=A0A4Q1C4G4_9BACT|nr:5'/3'-nucleotidase SurE [Oleiharenicola lentus]RXK53282.1 5'/3'-nucleotidase SurE [Oleiharenicola lentus]
MKLLVTNDDGINSVFLHELVFALKAAGHELFVVAPLTEQSWTGASKTRNRPVQSVRAEQGFGCPTWTVDGTPSDCVNIAIAHLLPGKVDAVVSGMNVGFNCTLGFVIASGTVAGAWEGALHGLPAMAVSQDVSESTYYYLKEHGGQPDAELSATLKSSAAHAARLAGELLPATAPRSFTVHNLNMPFPCRPDAAVKRTVLSQFFVPGLFSPPDADGRHKLIWTQGEDVSPPEPLTDLKCLESGSISHTVLDYRKLGR